jgi:hypothetical protein
MPAHASCTRRERAHAARVVPATDGHEDGRTRLGGAGTSPRAWPPRRGPCQGALWLQARTSAARPRSGLRWRRARPPLRDDKPGTAGHREPPTSPSLTPTREGRAEPWPQAMARTPTTTGPAARPPPRPGRDRAAVHQDAAKPLCGRVQRQCAALADTEDHTGADDHESPFSSGHLVTREPPGLWGRTATGDGGAVGGGAGSPCVRAGSGVADARAHSAVCGARVR